MAEGKILPLIVFSILIGIALNEKNKALSSARDFFKSFYEIIFKIVNWIMFIAPFGIFGLLVNMVVSQNYIYIFSQVGIFMLIVIGSNFISWNYIFTNAIIHLLIELIFFLYGEEGECHLFLHLQPVRVVPHSLLH